MAENTGGATSTSRLLRAEDGRGDSERGGASGRPKEPWKGEFVKSIVYAGLDAIVTCFSLISSISASRYSSGDRWALSHFYFFHFLFGFVNLLAKMKFIKKAWRLELQCSFFIDFRLNSQYYQKYIGISLNFRYWYFNHLSSQLNSSM